MIQIIGFLIAGYIVMRALAIICSNESQWRSSGAKTFMVIVALATIAGTGLLTIALLVSGIGSSTGIR